MDGPQPDGPEPDGPEPDDPVEVLRRWEDFGAVWRVVPGPLGRLTISLQRCDGGEEVSRLVSDDPALRAYVEERSAAEPVD